MNPAGSAVRAENLIKTVRSYLPDDRVAFVEMALAAAGQITGGRRHRVTDLHLHHPVVLSRTEHTVLQAVLDEAGGGAWRFRVYNRVGSAWTLSSTASLTDAQTPHEIRPDVLCRQ